MKNKNKKNIKKRILIFILSSTFIINILLIVFKNNYNENKIKNETINNVKLDIELIENLKVEINDKVKTTDFIKKINNGILINRDILIDTSKLGNKNINLKINYKNKIIDYNFNIEVIDTIGPVIESKNEITTYIGNTIDLTKDIKVSDNSNDSNINVTIEGFYDLNRIDNYNLNYIAIDKSGNKTMKPLTLKVIEKQTTNEIKYTSKGYIINIINGVTYIDNILIANKTYSLPNNYGSGLTIETKEAFNMMKADSSVLGLILENNSGYRSYYDQKYIYDNYVKKDGQKEADRYSARPGHSEHQTGLAFDLNSIDMSFDNTPESKWVKENCYKYGFIIRYPKGKEEITGYMYEPWHLRYVGIELATKLYNNGNWITLEEYFGIDSKYKY